MLFCRGIHIEVTEEMIILSFFNALSCFTSFRGKKVFFQTEEQISSVELVNS